MASHIREILDDHQENNDPVIVQLLEPCTFAIWAQTLREPHLQDAKCFQCWQDRPRGTCPGSPCIPEIFVLISTAMSLLSLFCKNRGNKRISPKTLVPNGIRRHERVIAETRNLLPYDGRTSPTYPCAHGREGLKATGNQFREF